MLGTKGRCGDGGFSWRLESAGGALRRLPASTSLYLSSPYHVCSPYLSRLHLHCMNEARTPPDFDFPRKSTKSFSRDCVGDIESISGVGIQSL